MPDLEHTAIERIKLGSMMSQKLYKKPLLITYSGGKDSDVLLHLAEISGEPFEVLHSLTTADAPETVRHVQHTFERLEEKGVHCEIDKHQKPDGTRVTMWNLIPKKLMPPTRIVRYCCAELKEGGGGRDRMISTGVRWAESVARKKNRGALEVQARQKEKRLTLNNDNDESRQLFESCQMKGKRAVNPIIEWSDDDVWDYIKSEHIETNPLYECGFNRVGCIGCPMAATKGRNFEFNRYPKIKAAYIRAFDKMLEERRKRGKMQGTWNMGTSGMDIFHWWMEDGVLPGQIELEGMQDT